MARLDDVVCAKVLDAKSLPFLLCKLSLALQWSRKSAAAVKVLGAKLLRLAEASSLRRGLAEASLRRILAQSSAAKSTARRSLAEAAADVYSDGGPAAAEASFRHLFLL